MSTKKTLVVKTSYDVTGMAPESLEFLKKAMKTEWMSRGLKEDQIDFEILHSNEEDRTLKLLQNVRNEFKTSEAKLARSRKNNTLAQAISDFFNSFSPDEDAEVVHDEE